MNARHEQILNRLRVRQTVTIVELAAELNVTRETIRKDLYELARRGLLTKVRGGAVLTAANTETSYSLRRATRSTAKEAIAAAAAELVAPDDVVYLDYGTTTYALAAALTRRAPELAGLTAVTCSLPIAQLLAGTEGITVMVPGGIVRGSEKSLHGPLATRNLRALHFNMCFLGVSGADPVNGFTAVHPLEAEVSALACERSTTTVVVADHSKLGVTAANATAPVERPALLITDVGADPEILTAFTDSGLDVRTV